MEIQLFKLYHNERDIDELDEEHRKKTNILEKEIRKREKIEDEIREKKKELGKSNRELTKLDQKLKEGVCDVCSMG
jgi:structural maintenance of chromosome 1